MWVVKEGWEVWEPGAPAPVVAIEHGTMEGLRSHRRDRRKPCRACLDAGNAYGRAHYAKWRNSPR